VLRCRTFFAARRPQKYSAFFNHFDFFFEIFDSQTGVLKFSHFEPRALCSLLFVHASFARSLTHSHRFCCFRFLLHISFAPDDFPGSSFCSSFATVAEVRQHLNDVIVVNVEDPRFGGAPLPFHWKVADPTGASIVIEIINGGQVRVYDSFMGVITNSPGYDWHLINLRNYVNLSPQPSAPVTLESLTFAPLGGGSGLLGLPGDFTPPSRFVRAAVLTATARPLPTAEDSVFEAFRILDSFNIPVGATAGRGKTVADIESATQITVASDLRNRRLYFHTMSNREVRMMDLSSIDFARVKEQMIDVDAGRKHVVREITLKER
jgi:choloylglycine hydrolase